MREGRFREDLLARINLWTFTLPGLAERREDIEPNLDYELDEFRRRTGTVVAFSKEAREQFLAFASSERARWPGNFRDLNAAITRLATLAPAGRITVDQVAAEVRHLGAVWAGAPKAARPGLVDRVLPLHAAADLDRFDRVQLDDVLQVCRSAQSLSAAGRLLFVARASESAAPTTPTACASTSRGSISTGAV